MDNYFNDPRLQQAQQAYQQTAQAANASAEGDMTLPSQLKEALNMKFSTNNPVIQEREGALKGYLDSIPQSQAAVLPENNNGVILSPIHQADLISKMQSSKLAPLSTLNYILGLQTGGISDVIESASAAHQRKTASLTNKAGLARNVYGDILNELSAKADQAFKERQFQENIRQFNVSEASKKLGSIDEQKSISALQRDVKRGTTFNELYDRYSEILPEWQIRELYNSGPVAKKYGPAKEKTSDLISGFANIKMTAEQKNRVASLKPAQAAVRKAMGEKYTGTGPQGLLQQFSIKKLGGLGVDQNLVRQNQTFEILRQNVVRAMQGARMSDSDIKIAKGYIPTINDTPATIKTKLEGLDEFMSNLTGEVSTSSSTDVGSWE